MGALVQIPLGNQRVTGIVLRETTKPGFPVKQIHAVRADALVPETSLDLLSWLRGYYPAPIGQTVDLFTPTALTQRGEDKADEGNASTKPSRELVGLPPMTKEQANVLKRLDKMTATSVLLQGVTGSGKTRVYLELARKTLDSGRSVLFLTPEIGLTTPLAKQIESHFREEVIIQHSGLTPAERRSQWLKVSRADVPLITVGARSALFLPHNNLGLIVVDEAHDTSYKQSQAPRYNALRVAGKLRELHRATLVFGTATPLVAERYQFESLDRPVLRLDTRAITNDNSVDRIIVDSRNRDAFTRSPYLSDSLIGAIQQAANANEQSLLFLNKRGSARMVLCQSCGWHATCPRCDISMTFHADTHNLRCHSCETSEPAPSSCPECGNTEILFKSIGTKALESEVRKLFPGARIGRFDSDTHKTTGLVARSSELQSGQIDIIIGTQTVTKGFDLPLLSVVGIIQADASMGIPDFTAHERTFQLISQVAGRIGRGHRPGKLVIQTYSPDNEVIEQAITGSYDSFYASELLERQRFRFPPFVHIATITCTKASREGVIKACEQLKAKLMGSQRVHIEGPAPRFIEKQRGKYAWQLILRSSKRSDLVRIVSQLPSGWTHDLDPIDLL
ncbi:primosomal protein N' [Candidatus Saccharibacteria bacterium]|nr:primosomal protein N' [Candidatus Saccharibacteria bacterium]